ncbi:hypothetical protein BN988_02180 [Oceanobacillus picturae]|uniref:Uncharacterized protein n=1 Tax=Oceanobacillus picturae TaxID=171693 RepID=W9ALA0_9BACI|nr:hypothetical protein [Oceanobacillus picturae]CDO03662.1 hypothetical protein BN988_02180 [Oceanobacillus picturae]
MWLLSELFFQIGNSKIQRQENAVELDTTNGEWVYNETIRDYDFIEKPISEMPKWVSVVSFDEEYIIIIDDEPFEEVEPIVTINCADLAEVRTVIKVLKAVYSSKGNVHIEILLSDYAID